MSRHTKNFWWNPLIRRGLVAALVISFLGAGCGSSDTGGIVDSFPKEPVTIKVWRPLNEFSAYLDLANNYNNIHPNVKIEYRYIPEDQYEATVLNAWASGQGPDIVSLRNDRLVAFRDKLTPMPLNFFEGAPLIPSLSSRYAPAVMTDTNFNGKIYGIPLYTDTLALYMNRQLVNDIYSAYTSANRSINQDLLRRGPIDWNELVDFTKLVTLRDGDKIVRAGVALGLSSNVPHESDIAAAIMLQQGVSMTSPDNRQAAFHLASADNPKYYPGAATLDFLKGFVDPHSSYYSWNADQPNAIDAFLQGKLVAMINYQDIDGYLKQRNPGLDYVTIPLPQTANASRIVDYANYHVEAVSHVTKYPQVVWDFLRNATGMGSYEGITGHPAAVRQSDTLTTVSQRADNTNPFNLQVPTAVSWYKGYHARDVDGILDRAVDRTSRGEMPAKDSIVQAASEFTKELGQIP